LTFEPDGGGGGGLKSGFRDSAGATFVDEVEEVEGEVEVDAKCRRCMAVDPSDLEFSADAGCDGAEGMTSMLGAEPPELLLALFPPSTSSSKSDPSESLNMFVAAKEIR